MRTEELDFELPPELIAQVPRAERTASRLMHYRREGKRLEHRTFSDLPQLLRGGDLLVFNDARVVPARFLLRKSTGGRVEGLFLRELARGRWLVMLKNAGNASEFRFEADEGIVAFRAWDRGGGECELALTTPEPAMRVLSRVGRMPLPPYIKREKGHDERDEMDRERYQTIYAREAGAVAAPTAGLHFTESLLAELNAAGIRRTFVTLHVGLGTFKPVTAERLEDHDMHVEAYTIGPEAAEALNAAKREGRRIVGVGTTSARVLESQRQDEPFAAHAGETGIFIYPPYHWKHVGAMITNFHLPRSTLIALVAAMVGLDQQRRLYAEAIQHRYRFFSYGDAMFIE